MKVGTDRPISGQDSLSSRKNRQWKPNLHGITCSNSVGSFGKAMNCREVRQL